MKSYYIWKKNQYRLSYNIIYFCFGKADFSVAITHVIFQKSFRYADLVLKKQFLLTSELKTVELFNVVVETVTDFQDS